MTLEDNKLNINSAKGEDLFKLEENLIEDIL